jgi:hypothetical protein
MKTYILGYMNPEDSELTEFKTKAEADFNSEEWAIVNADSLEEAKSKYEAAFQSWKNEEHIS